MSARALWPLVVLAALAGCTDSTEKPTSRRIAEALRALDR